MRPAQTEWHRLAAKGAQRAWPIRRAFAVSTYLALALASFVAARRLNGSLAAPSPAVQLVPAATILLAWALATRAIVPGRLAAWLPAGILLLFAIALSSPGERAVDWIVWLTVFGAYLASTKHPLTRSHTSFSRDEGTTERGLRSKPAPDGQVLQQLTRSRTTDGSDVMHGTLHAEFAAGQRAATLYVAFCPPFERLPRVEVESSADVKIVQVLHQGAQLEVRLPRAPKSPTSAAVELFAIDSESA